MQIIQYEEKGNTISCGFKENNYVVYAQTGVKEGYRKSDYLQHMYQEIKHALDYERNLYNQGGENSIIVDDTLELDEDGNPIESSVEIWSPEPPKVSSIEIDTNKSYVLFGLEETEKTVEVSAVVYDQYGDVYDGEMTITTDVGTYADGVLTLARPESDGKVIITATVDEFVETKEISIELEPPFDIEGEQKRLIEETKIELEKFLEENPYQHVDGKLYSVTKDKQNLLNNAIAVYQMKVQAGLPAEITWNATGEVCTVWTIEETIELALAIAGYVEPLVSHQQELEVSIKNCTTEQELKNVVIDYATV